MILYHVTHKGNLKSILREGIDPRYSRGRAKVVWLCHHRRIQWALEHVSERDHVNIDDLAILRVQVQGADARRTRYTSVYTVPDPVHAILSVRLAFAPGDLCPS